MKLKRYLLAFFTILSAPIGAWTDAGHMVVAEIAYSYLLPATKTGCDDLLQILSPFFPDAPQFTQASTWADLLKMRGFHAFDSWHFTLQPYDPEGILPSQDGLKSGQNANIEWAIEQAVSTLKNEQAKDFEKSLMLFLLIHLVADIHQPLHVTSLFSPQFPQGDRGGNLFMIRSHLAANLHLLWDLGLGALPLVERPPSAKQKQEIRDYAKQAMQRYPIEALPNASSLHIKGWLKEGFELARDSVYKIKSFTEPPREYVSEGQEICQRQIVLAGYRLANLLNEIFGEF